MRISIDILASLLLCSILHGQELTRGSYRLTVDDLRSVEASIRLTLAGPSGSVFYQIKREMPYDSPKLLLHLFSNGSVLVVDAFAGVYERYGENGRLIERFSLNEKIRPNHERIVLVSGNDSTAVLLVSEPGQAVSRIVLLDASGTRKLDSPVGGTFASGLMLSPNGTLIAIGSYSWEGSTVSFESVFIKTDGTPVFAISHEFKGGSWSPDGRLFAMYGRKEAIVINVAENGILATMDLGENKVVHEIYWDNSVPLLLCSPPPDFSAGNWIYSRLAVLNLTEQRIIYQSDASFRNVKLEKNGPETSVKIDDRLVRIK